MQLDDFTRAYLECALATCTDNSTPSGGYPLDRNYNLNNFAPEAIATAEAECAVFQNENADALDNAGTEEQNGHDFWLTRNQHGAGFWCRGYDEDTSRILTDAAHAHGECHAYLHDRRIIHLYKG